MWKKISNFIGIVLTFLGGLLSALLGIFLYKQNEVDKKQIQKVKIRADVNHVPIDRKNPKSSGASFMTIVRAKQRPLQSNSNFNEMINKYGCNFLSHLGIAQSHSKRNLTVDEIKDLYNYCYAQDFIDSECTVKSKGTSGIINKAFEVLEVKKRAVQIGTALYDGIPMFYNRESENNRIDSTILRYKVDNAEHYREGDNNYKVVYDPSPSTKVDKLLAIWLYRVDSV